jgi:hypothetical protein
MELLVMQFSATSSQLLILKPNYASHRLMHFLHFLLLAGVSKENFRKIRTVDWPCLSSYTMPRSVERIFMIVNTGEFY